MCACVCVCVNKGSVESLENGGELNSSQLSHFRREPTSTPNSQLRLNYKSTTISDPCVAARETPLHMFAQHTAESVVETDLCYLCLGGACHHAVLALHGPAKKYNGIHMTVTCAGTGQRWSRMFTEADIERVHMFVCACVCVCVCVC